MRKLLLAIVFVASFGFAGLVTEAKPTTSVAAETPQLRIQIGQQHNRRWRHREVRRGHGRVYTQTRFVRRGYATYRETYQIRTFANGETQTTLISRVRVA